ncbi:MAG: hypothetical protein JXR49_05910 [Acidobacteria bacterium]|nr:hypothetical protein [Acidobacteriota bacterium]MBN2704554.1 hypothetical protein [Pontiellaceae bacterium]
MVDEKKNVRQRGLFDQAKAQSAQRGIAATKVEPQMDTHGHECFLTKGHKGREDSTVCLEPLPWVAIPFGNYLIGRTMRSSVEKNVHRKQAEAKRR